MDNKEFKEDYIEISPIPERCVGCIEDCYNCEYTLDRWQPTKEQELKSIIRYKLNHIKLLKRQLAEVEAENKKGIKDGYVKLLNRQIKTIKNDIVKLEKARDREAAKSIKK